jgi:translation initiation factor 1
VTKDRPRDDRAAPERPAPDKPVIPRGAPPAAPLRSNPFARLEALRGSLPTGPVDAAQATPAPDARPRGPARAVVRMERKGRGGKEVTVVDKLGLGPAALEAWCRDLKQALGCGGSVDGELIVLQGDLRARAPAVLTARGVGKVTVG